jgi:hypothetical protein
MEYKELEKTAHKILCDYGIYSVSQRIGILGVKKLMVKMANLQKEQDNKMYSEDEVLNIIKARENYLIILQKTLYIFL